MVKGQVGDTLRKTGQFENCRALLFDFGGTLDSDGGHWLDRFYALYAQFKPDLSQDEIKRIFYHADKVCCEDPAVNRMGLRELMSYHINVQFQALSCQDNALIETVTDCFCTETEQYLQRNTFLLGRLQRRYKLGIISNFYGNVPNICHETGIDELCDVILDSVRVDINKPDPKIFHIALNKLKLPPEQVGFVGDSFCNDILPAKKIGMQTFWLKGTYPYIPDDIEAPERFIDTTITALTELEDLLL